MRSQTKQKYKAINRSEATVCSHLDIQLQGEVERSLLLGTIRNKCVLLNVQKQSQVQL